MSGTGPAMARPAGGPAGGLLLNTLVIPMRWGDMDALGHVNNTVYFRYMEEARMAWLDDIGVRAGPAGQGPVVVHVACTFQIPFVHPGHVVARHYATAVGRSSVDTRVEMAREDAPGRICAHGTARIVWVDFASGRSTPLPEALRARLAALAR